VLADVLVRVLVHHGHALDVRRLERGEADAEAVPQLEVDVAAEVRQALVLLLAHVLVVRHTRGVDALPPAFRADRVRGGVGDAVADVVVVADGVLGLLRLARVVQAFAQLEEFRVEDLFLRAGVRLEHG
jgi:hypothetical protein